MADPDSGKILAGRYRLERLIGRGAMGSVWAGSDDKLRRPVAIKLMTDRAVSYEHALARFEQEAMAVARLRSPYVVQVYDYGLDGQCPFIVMELLEGEDLGTLLKRSLQPLAMSETTRIIVQTAKGLHAAHQAGVVHRDLKPANIFLVQEHGEAIAKVFDFGIAKALSGVGSDSEMTAEGVLLGTPRYMSPEQAHGSKHVDHRTDLWSLGVIAYHCVTGRYPFKGSGLGEIIANICTVPFTPPSQLFPYLPPEMDQFFEKALAKEPTDRFESARDLGAAFARLTDASIPSLELPVGHAAEIPCPALDATGGTRAAALERSLESGHGARADAGRAPNDDGHAAVDSSRAGAEARGDGAPDGTLGPAAHTPNERATRRWRIGLVAAVLFGLAAGASIWVVTRGANSEGAGSTGTSAAQSAEPVAESPSTQASASAADSGVPASSDDAGTASAPPEARGTRAVRSGRGGRSSTPSSTGQSTSATATPGKPTAAPPPKPTGDGLDQFDNRF